LPEAWGFQLESLSGKASFPIPECLRISPELQAVRRPFETRLGPRTENRFRGLFFVISQLRSFLYAGFIRSHA
jgi:hypothetical protein